MLAFYLSGVESGLWRTYPDQAVVSIFYAAVHSVEGFFAPRQHSSSHQDRQMKICAHPVAREIYDNYRALEDKAWDARYTNKRVGSEEPRGLYANELVPIGAKLNVTIPTHPADKVLSQPVG